MKSARVKEKGRKSWIVIRLDNSKRLFDVVNICRQAPLLLSLGILAPEVVERAGWEFRYWESPIAHRDSGTSKVCAVFLGDVVHIEETHNAHARTRDRSLFLRESSVALALSLFLSLPPPLVGKREPRIYKYNRTHLDIYL